MTRYRKQQTPGDNLRDLYSKVRQQTSSGLGNSSIDYEGPEDDGESLDITVGEGDDYTTVAKYGHDGTRHGFLVPNGSGWRTVQEDAQARADAAEADANAHANSLNAAMDARMDTVESSQADMWGDITALQSDLAGLRSRVSSLESRVSDLEN